MAATQNGGPKWRWKEFVEICQLLTFKIEKRCRTPAITISLVYSIDFCFLAPCFAGDFSSCLCLTCARSVTAKCCSSLILINRF